MNQFFHTLSDFHQSQSLDKLVGYTNCLDSNSRHRLRSTEVIQKDALDGDFSERYQRRIYKMAITGPVVVRAADGTQWQASHREAEIGAVSTRPSTLFGFAVARYFQTYGEYLDARSA